jgi:protein-tyrosine phosphatase
MEPNPNEVITEEDEYYPGLGCDHKSLTDFAIGFYQNAYFGCYPTIKALELLEEMQFDFIVKLTCEPERNISPYMTKLHLIHYPIKDNNVPVDWETFSMFVTTLVEYIREGKKIFIHCKGGHGRSCLVVTCILYLIDENANARDSIEKTIAIHNQRQDLSSRWKNIRSPFSKTQYLFLYKFLNPVCILKSYNIGYQAGFSGSSSFQLKTEYGNFSNVDAAFQSLKTTQIDWDDYTIMLYLTRIKFQQYPELIPNLLITGIRKIYDFSRYSFGNNLIGRCLIQIRSEILIAKCKDKIVF